MENNFALQKQREKVFMARANSAVGMFEFKLCFFSLCKKADGCPSSWVGVGLSFNLQSC